MKDNSLKKHAYEYIRNKLIRCDYLPGEFLDEKQLITELNISRTPIREAVIMLEQENYLKILPKRGIVVCDITIKNIVDAYEVRIIIETYAVRNHHDTYSEETLLQFKKEIEKIISQEYQEVNDDLDDQFHHYICNYNNSFISGILRDVTDQNTRARNLVYHGTRNKINTANEHLKIIDELLAKDYAAAEACLLDHLEKGKKAAIEYLTKI